ncbi:hypothetical protein E1293_11475 [Actinomadura darangshiensis]|uniref:Uncharacterized protein n=1 Tax=Actinomadura darangshiensis TaxID=705336 RepID=A0A4R5BHM3_9ACTN|nr:hypothetical protein E1293_11475 [Actinomadura darangshiensis]
MFRQRSAVLEEILRDLTAEKLAWEAVDACFKDRAAERLRRWQILPEEGGYDLHQRRALITEVISAVLVFPAGRGRRRRRKEGYLPIVNQRLVVPGGA